MADITKLIQQYLLDHPNAMAKTIASALSKSRSEVNSCLYASKGKLFEVNDCYQWSLKVSDSRQSNIKKVQESTDLFSQKTNQFEKEQTLSQRYFIVFEGTHYRFVISDKTPPISERGYAAEIFDIDKPQFILYEYKFKKNGLKPIIHIIPLMDNFNSKNIHEIHDIPIGTKEKSPGQVTNVITAFHNDYIVVYHYDNNFFFYPRFFLQVFKISDYYSRKNQFDVTLLTLGEVYSLCVLPKSENISLDRYNTGTEWTGIMITSETENDFNTLQSVLRKHGYNIPKPYPFYSKDKNYLSNTVDRESNTIEYFNSNPESPVYGKIYREKIIHIPVIRSIGLQNKTGNRAKDEHTENENYDTRFESNIHKNHDNSHPFYSLSEEHYGNPNFGYNGRENETIEFYISIGNKKRITGTTAAEALVNALNEMLNYTTIERMANIPIFVDRMPFISKTHQNIRRASFYPLKNGWWVNTHLSNEAKKRNLEKIAHFCGILIEVHLEMTPI